MQPRQWAAFQGEGCLEELFELLDDLVTDLGGGSVTAEVSGSDGEAALVSSVEDLGDSSLYGVGGLGLVERVAEEHGGGEDGADGVGDALSGDIGCRAVDGFVEAVALSLSVWEAGEGGGREEAERAGDDGRLVREDVAKHVFGEDDAVELARVGDHDHGGRVYELVVARDAGGLELGVDRVLDDAAPETGGGEYVSLVDGVDDGRRVGLEGEVGGESGDALHVVAVVDHGVERVADRGGVVEIGLLALAKVEPLDELTDDDKLGAARNLWLEGRVVEQRLGGEATGPDVGVQVELLAQTEESLLRSHLAHAPLGPTDSAEQNSIRVLARGKRVVRKRLARRVDAAAAKVVLCTIGQ